MTLQSLFLTLVMGFTSYNLLNILYSFKLKEPVTNLYEKKQPNLQH